MRKSGLRAGAQAAIMARLYSTVLVMKPMLRVRSVLGGRPRAVP